MVRLAENLRAHLSAHAVLRHHGACHLRGALQVVACAGRDVVAENLLCHATAQEHGQVVEHLLPAVEYLVLLRDGQGVTQRTAARDDRNLVHRIGARQQMADQGMTALVVSDGALRLVVHDAALALRTGNHALHGLAHLLHGDDLFVATCREQRGFVQQVGQVGAGKARRELGDLRKVDVLGNRLVARMHLQDALAAFHVRRVHHNLAVETARAQQRRIQNIRAVCRSDEHDRVVGLEAVHLHEQLVQGLLALVVTAAQARTTLTADRVDLVDEDDGGAGLFRVLEQVAHARGAHADEHLDEVGARNAEERNAGLACNRARQQRLTGARRADEQAAARNLSAHGLVFGRVRQEVLNLLHLLDRFIDACDVRELHARTLFDVVLRLRLAERHLRIVRLLHLGEDEEEEHRDKDDGQEGRQDAQPRGRQRDVVLNVRMGRHELAERVGPHVGRGKVALRAQRGSLDVGRAYAREHAAVRTALHAQQGVQCVKGRVEGVRHRGPRRHGRIVRAAHGVPARVVVDREHATLLDRRHELRREQGVRRLLVGGRVHEAHELAAHEKRDDQEAHRRHDGHPGIRLLLQRLFVLI